MKKIIPFVAAVLVALSSQAQNVNIHLTDANKTVVKYNASQVDYIDFTKPIAASQSLEAVDLGLPSGRKWANINVGATAPEDYGTYFAWGEIQPKESYGWNNYQWGAWNDVFQKAFVTKYNYTLNPEDDAASINWGGKWRMPTMKEFQELIDNTTVSFETKNDSVVVKLTSTKNGASIYLPTAGYWNGRHITFERENAYYWTSTLHESTQNNQHVFAYAGTFVENSVTPKCVTNYKRPWGMPVRPVIAKSDADVYSNAPAGAEAVDLGLSVLWANMNVGATAAEEWGNFYSWGETFTRNEHGWYYEYVTGKDAEGKDIAVTTNISNYKWGAYDTGFTGYTGATVLEPADDAATANWGSEWRMPTKEDFEELIAYTTYKKHQVNGVWGGLFTGSNGNTIFLPAGGYHNEESLNTVGSNGVYYSSTVNTNNCLTAYFMNITGTSCEINSYIRPRGYNVRAVKAE